MPFGESVCLLSCTFILLKSNFSRSSILKSFNYTGKKLHLPYRAAFGIRELFSVLRLFLRSWVTRQDFGFEGESEKLFTSMFADMVGHRYCDAVNSGSSAIWISLQSIGISEKDQVIVSPVTNPGAVMPLALMGASIRIADSARNSYNMSYESFVKLVNSKTKAVIVTHVGGIPCADINRIKSYCIASNIFLIEDCSQAHGSFFEGQLVGSLANISVWSTMFSKLVASGSCGGVLCTSDTELYYKIRSFSDRGKHFDDPMYNARDTHKYKFPSLNFNQSEINCAIGISSLSRLRCSVRQRSLFAQHLADYLDQLNALGRVHGLPTQETTGFFYLTIAYPSAWISSRRTRLCSEILARGILINPYNRELVVEWPWVGNKFSDDTPNAKEFRDLSFNLLFNERYSRWNAKAIARMIAHCERLVF